MLTNAYECSRSQRIGENFTETAHSWSDQNPLIVNTCPFKCSSYKIICEVTDVDDSLLDITLDILPSSMIPYDEDIVFFSNT